MKTRSPFPAFRSRQSARQSIARQKSGFSLVVTVTLLVLLSMIAVALLSLSSTTLRASRADGAQKLARSNARLALAMALGELQKNAGSDMTVTAPGTIVDRNAPLGLTGTWESYRPGRDGKNYENKNAFFQGWLVSTLENGPSRSSTIPNLNGGGSVELLGEGTLGSRVSRTGGDATMRGIQVPVMSGDQNVGGHYAWAVMEEGTKARLNLPGRVQENDLAHRVAAAGVTERDAVWYNQDVAAFEKLDTDNRIGDKLISFQEAKLYSGDRDAVGKNFHDYSVHSSGLLTNTADGGLKEDLSLMFDNLTANGGSLPGGYAGKRLYEEWTGFDTDRSTPYWDYLGEYATLYKRLTQINGVPGYLSDIQSNQAFGRDITSTPAPQEPLLAPVVARVELVFSLLCRNAHGGWAAQVAPKPYMLHMLYSPVVTLYNPYNVPIQFNGMELEFEDLPVGFRFHINGTPMTRELAPLNNLYVGNEAGTGKKTFGFTISEELGNSRSGSPSIIEPGATRMFGINAEPEWSWAKDRPGDGSTIFDWRNDKTAEFTLARGWSSGMGFDIDWLAPQPLKTPQNQNPAGIIGCAASDRINVEFGPAIPRSARGSFSVNIAMLNSRRRPVPYGKIEVQYGSKNVLENVLAKRGTGDVTYPLLLERPVIASRIFEPDARPISDYIATLPFAAFSVRGKTTLKSNEWVRSWVDSTPATRAARLDLTQSESQGAFPYEVSFHPVSTDPNSDAGSFDIDDDDRGYYFTGHDIQFGTLVASAYEVPYAPLQSIAQLRHANLNNTGRYPYTTYSVGESFLNAYLPGNTYSRTAPEGYEALDHTWLANDALWDRYFFSTVCSEEGLAFESTSRSRQDVLEGFFSGSKPLMNPRFQPIAGSGVSTSERITELDSELGYLRSAEFMSLAGMFNVNSTSTEAWKAVLGGMEGKELETYMLKILGEGGSYSVDEIKLGSTAFPRVRRPVGPPVGDVSGDDPGSRFLRWCGFRDASDGSGSSDKLDDLAEAIVEQVRERGPFLSMGEFVNRQLGNASSEASRKGALQAAIDLSKMNRVLEADGVDLTSANVGGYGYMSPEAVNGSSTAEASPGSLTQGDILSVIGSRISVRSDTFTVRAYGNAVDRNGQILSQAWCEAIVQRTPEFVDNTQPASTTVDLLKDVNLRFGRRFSVVSFRWLSPEEV